MEPAGFAAFIRAHTEVEDVPGLGVRLHLATRITPLWTATEALLAEREIEPPYWAFAWPGSVAMSHWIARHPERVRGRTLLDFAAGCGLTAIVALRAGARRAVAVEIDPLAGAAIEANAALAGVTPEVWIRDLLDQPPPEGVDVLVTGDVCYSRPMAERLVAWLRRCAAAGIEVWVADPGRMYAPTEGVEEVDRFVIPTLRELEDRDERVTRILRVLP